jgi:6-phosphogluconolactonase
MSEIEAFADRDASAEVAAAAIADALTAPGPKTFAATGGTTPGPAYDRLSQRDLGWERVTVAPTDERFVDPRSQESNERLLRARLITGQAAAARLISLKGAGPTPQADAAAAEPNIRAALPFAAMLLGMGGDGHIGSLFPGDPDLAAWLDPAGERLCVGVAESPDPPRVPRISLTVAAMLRCGLIVVLVSGKDKRTVIERVLTDAAYAPPVAAILRQSKVPVRILWAP